MSTPISPDSPSPMRGGMSAAGRPGVPVDVQSVGVEYIKFLQVIRENNPECFPMMPAAPAAASASASASDNSGDAQGPVPNEVAGIHPNFFPACEYLADSILKQFAGAKRLTVVFDGLMLSTTLAENHFSEDVAMALAWHLVAMHHEVIFAPFLATTQLQFLRSTGHVQVFWRLNPPTIPSALLKWNDAEVHIPNIHTYAPALTLRAYSPGSQQFVTVCISPADERGVQQSDTTGKVLDRWNSLDALPNSAPVLFLLQLAGVISPKLARALAQRLVESDGVARDRDAEAALFQFMAVLLPLRAQIVHQLVSDVINGPLYLRWDESNANATPPLIGLDAWNIGDFINGTNGPNARNHDNYLEPWGLTDVMRFESCATSGDVAVDIYSLVPTVILRALDLMGYFTHAQEEVDPSQPNHNEHSSSSIYGAALKCFEGVPELGEAAVLFIELVRTNAFNILRQPDGPASTDAETSNGTAATSGGDERHQQQQAQQQQGGDDIDSEGSEDEIPLNTAEDICVKIACLVPIQTTLDMSTFPEPVPASAAAAAGQGAAAASSSDAPAAPTSPTSPLLPVVTEEKSAEALALLATQTQFLKAAQAHVRSLRMLVEASAGNVVLRDFATAYQQQRSERSIATNQDLLATVAAALPFRTPPSQRALFFYAAAKQCKGDVDALCAQFNITDARAREVAAADMQRLKDFALHCAYARQHLAVEDEDVGLDPNVIKRVEPAVAQLCEAVGVALPPQDPSLLQAGQQESGEGVVHHGHLEAAY